MAEEKKRILFVDDEINILNGLRRLLHTHRDRWRVDIAIGPEQALEKLKKSHFHAIVSDMIMPGMNGLELLKIVRDQYPDMIRIMLSGQSEKEQILHSVDYIHDYLPKPCDTEVMITTFKRAFSIRDEDSTGRIKEVISEMSSLPVLPQTYQRILDELESPNLSLKSIGEIISHDMAIATKVLKLVNSAYFGLRIKVSSPVQAAKLLGVNTVKALALSVEVFNQFEQKDLSGIDLNVLWEHSSMVGGLARRISAVECDDERETDHALIGGLLHDVGILVMATRLSSEYQLAVKMAGREGIPLFEAEKKTIGVTHAEIGAFLLDMWNLSDRVVEAVKYHHDLRKSSKKGFSALTAIHVANALHNDYSLKNVNWGQTELDIGFLDSIRYSHKIPDWQRLTNELQSS